MAENNIQDLLNRFLRKELDQENIYTIVGAVSNVDEAKRTCDLDPFDGTAKRTGCRLQASISNADGFVQIPTDGSTIAVTFFDRQKGFVSLFTEVDKILSESPLFEFNGGSLDGITKVNDVVTTH